MGEIKNPTKGNAKAKRGTDERFSITFSFIPTSIVFGKTKTTITIANRIHPPTM